MSKNKFIEEIERDCFIEDLGGKFDKETVETIVEAVEHPETLHKLTSWKDLDL